MNKKKKKTCCSQQTYRYVNVNVNVNILFDIRTHICLPEKINRCCCGGIPSFSSTRSFILSTLSVGSMSISICKYVVNLLTKEITSKHCLTKVRACGVTKMGNWLYFEEDNIARLHRVSSSPPDHVNANVIHLRFAVYSPKVSFGVMKCR